MTIHLLPVDGATDSGRVAELLHAVSARPISADWLRLADHATPEGHIRWRVAAVAEGGALVGYAETGRDPRMEPGRFWLLIAVDPAHRNRGIGAMLYDDVSRFAWEMGATHLACDVRHDQPEALAFAQRRGFVVTCAGSRYTRLRLGVACGVPPSPRDAVKAWHYAWDVEYLALGA